MSMTSALKGVSVLVVDDDTDVLDMMHLGLGAVGAEVRIAATAEAALAILETWRPDVVLSDLDLPGVDGFEFLELLRSNPRLSDIPAAALSGAPQRTSDTRRFEKYLSKPTRLPEIIIALATLARQERPERRSEHQSSELRAALARLNGASGCRFTSLLRFGEDDTLTSIWTYDRERPKIDPFPLGLPVHVSYCTLVRETGEMCVIEDSALDARVADHPKREQLACYAGAPLFREDGSMFGTVCCYDDKPHAVLQVTRDAIAAAAREVQPWLNALFADEPSLVRP